MADLKDEIKKVSENEYEIPKSEEEGMNVPCKIFANEKLMKGISSDNTLEQVKNVSKLPGIQKASIALPDAHRGYGMSIGGVAAFDTEEGIISPGMNGFDINCGVRILATDITKEEFLKRRSEVLHEFKRTVPSGVGKGHKSSEDRLDMKDLDDVLKKGSKWAVENGYGRQEDLERCEENGCMSEADPENVSERAKKRGLPQVGTLGAGNHFLEVQEVKEIFDEETAENFGLKKNHIVVMIHCGSRGLGHQIASDYMKEIEEKCGHPYYDRELSHTPINSHLGKKYFSAMACAVNFAFCNRQLIMHYVREVLDRFFPDHRNQMVYDVCHNISKFETHNIESEKQFLVTRKGATRAFGPGRQEVPEVYRQVGQPVIIPGSMGTNSYVLVGTKKAEEISFGSTAHGAGRVMSRKKATSSLWGENIQKDLKQNKDIELEAGSKKGIAEEAPQAYKDIESVVEVSDALGIGNKVVQLRPLAVMKG